MYSRSRWKWRYLIKNIDLLDCNVKYILLTHGHFDHVEALKEVAEKYNAPIYMNKNEIDFMKNDKTVFGALPKKYNLVEDGDTLPFGDGVIKCIHTPGHT